MIYRAIVEEIITPYQIRVRIPIIHRAANSPDATPSAQLPVASVCILPNIYLRFNVGDIVIVSFENNDSGKPIILGYLYRELTDVSNLSANFSNLSAVLSADLPANTNIGKISSEKISYLENLQGNIQKQIDLLKEQINLLKKS